MNKLFCIGINIDQLIKELLWFEDALANGYQRQLCYSKTIVLERLLFSKDYCYTKSHDKMDTTAYWHTYPTDWETLQRENKEENRRNKPYQSCSRVKIAISLSN